MRARSGAAGWAVLTSLVALSCGGRAMRTEGEAATAVGSGGAETAASGSDGSTAESVVSSATTNGSGVVGVGGAGGSGGSDGSGGFSGTTGSGATGGGAGFGGSAGFGGYGGGAGFGGYGGGAIVTVASASANATMPSGGWGDVPVPEYCHKDSLTYLQGESCELTANCAAQLLSAVCTAEGDTYSCACTSEQLDYSYRLYGVTASNACDYTIAACLQESPFEAGAFACMATFEDFGMDACGAQSACTRDAVIDEVKLIESSVRTARCRPGTSGWLCECDGPVRGTRFEVPSGSSETLCLDARDWCAGEGVEVGERRDCSMVETVFGSDHCRATVECQQSVLASGQEVTRIETLPVECVLYGDGTYACVCPLMSTFYVYGSDPQSVCITATGVCGGQP